MSEQLTVVRRPRWRRIVRGVILSAVALCVIALVVETVGGYVVARQLRDEIAKIRAAGEPVTFGDLDADRPEMKEGDDAARYYAAALALVPGIGSEPHHEISDVLDAYYCDALKESGTSQPAGDVVEAAERILADNALVLDMVERGSRCPACRYDIGVEQSMEGCLERLAGARSIMRLLVLKAGVRASRGDGDGAADSLVDLLRMMRMFDRRPVLIAYLVEVAGLALAVEDLKIVLEVGQPSEARLHDLQKALSDAWSPEKHLRMALAERVYGIEMMRNLMTGTVNPRPPGGLPGERSGAWPAGSFWSRPYAQWLAVGYLRDMGRFVSDSRQAFREATGAASSGTRMASELGEIVGPGMARSVDLAARSVARIRGAAVAVMIERYRRARGTLPASLDDLVPMYAESLPPDPFTGGPLRYRHDERSYVVYSVGEDKTDDEGDVDAETANRQPRREPVPRRQPHISRQPGEQEERPRDEGLRIRLPAPIRRDPQANERMNGALGGEGQAASQAMVGSHWGRRAAAVDSRASAVRAMASGRGVSGGVMQW